MSPTDRTPDFSTVIRQALDRRDASLRVSLPGIITRFDKDTFLCDVQPLLKDVDTRGRAIDLPIINNVRLWTSRVGLAVIYLPVRVGDKVGLIFADRSLDLWEDSDGDNTLDPQDTRKHNLTDAWAIPGLYPTGDVIPSTVDPADIRVILYDTDGNVRSEFYVGGDTGDIVSIPENKVMLGSANPAKGAARETDPTISTSTEDATYWAWLLGFVNVFLIPPGGSWAVVAGDGGLALQTAMTAYLLANPVPAQLAGKISAASTKVFAED